MSCSLFNGRRFVWARECFQLDNRSRASLVFATHFHFILSAFGRAEPSRVMSLELVSIEWLGLNWFDERGEETYPGGCARCLAKHWPLEALAASDGQRTDAHFGADNYRRAQLSSRLMLTCLGLSIRVDSVRCTGGQIRFGLICFEPIDSLSWRRSILVSVLPSARTFLLVSRRVWLAQSSRRLAGPLSALVVIISRRHNWLLTLAPRRVH